MFRLLMWQGLRPVLIGGAIGVAAAGGIALALRSTLISPSSPDLLFGIGAFDPATFLGLCGFLACVALLASALPARRALAVDPVIALRSE